MILLRVATAMLLGSLVIPTPARAEPIITLNVAGGWMDFSFGGPWHTAFSLSAPGRTRITVTDYFLSGDQFLVSITGTGAGTGSFTTSLPTVIRAFTEDPDFAASDPRWSSRMFFVSPGEYVVSGTAIRSPFGGGTGAIRADTAPVAEPTTVLLLATGLAGLATRRRRRHREGV
jgi:hypothetical protein